MPNTIAAYLGLGANLGDPIQQLIDARSALYALESSVAGKCSSFYQTSPVGYDAQPNFVNCVVELTTSLSAIELLNVVQAIETGLGRQRVTDNQNAPRIIDIDILLFGDQTIVSKRLCVPHPRMYERMFVLAPLSEFNLQSESLSKLHSMHLGKRLEDYISDIDKTQFADQIVHRLSIH